MAKRRMCEEHVRAGEAPLGLMAGVMFGWRLAAAAAAAWASAAVVVSNAASENTSFGAAPGAAFTCKR